MSRTLWLVAGLGVAVVCAIAIPNLKLARMTANEAAARRSLHAVNSAQTQFAKLNSGRYACALRALGEARLIADSLARGRDRGYLFNISACAIRDPEAIYKVIATPEIRNGTGYWVFFTDQAGRVEGSSESVEDCLNRLRSER